MTGTSAISVYNLVVVRCKDDLQVVDNILYSSSTSLSVCEGDNPLGSDRQMLNILYFKLLLRVLGRSESMTVPAIQEGGFHNMILVFRSN